MKPSFQFSLGRLFASLTCFAFAAWATNGLGPPANWIDSGDFLVGTIVSFAFFLGVATLGCPPKYSISAFFACEWLMAVFLYYHNG
jgi:hypothetical protein